MVANSRLRRVLFCLSGTAGGSGGVCPGTSQSGAQSGVVYCLAWVVGRAAVARVQSIQCTELGWLGSASEPGCGN
jgi:hypothetical protein